MNKQTKGLGTKCIITLVAVVACMGYACTAALAAAGDWVWLEGSNTTNQPGVYGGAVPGPGDASTTPGARWGAASWEGPSGTLYLFGGSGYAASGGGRLNDLWQYDPGTGFWTWLTGSNSANQVGVYGVLDTPNALNTPGARYQSVTWVGASGELYLFGGYGYPASGSQGRLNDLWRYEPGSGLWTWLAGSNAINQLGAYGAPAAPGARNNAVGWAGAAGTLYLFGGTGYGAAGGYGTLNDLWSYDLGTGTWSWLEGSNVINQPGVYGVQGTGAVLNTPGARYGAVSWEGPSGELYLFGGTGYAATGAQDRLNDLWRYEPGTGFWTWLEGSNATNQLGTYGTPGVPDTLNTPGARNAAVSWVGASGTLYLFGGNGYPAAGATGYLNDLWRYDVGTGFWTWLEGSDAINQPGVYGTPGVFDVANTPGARYRAVGWVGAAGALYLFGGTGYPATGGSGILNDLWQSRVPTPPEVASAAATDSITVRVVFDKDMADNAALVNAANYTFTDGGAALTAASVVRIDATTVDVTVNEMTDGASYTANVDTSSSGPTDTSLNHVLGSANSAAFTGIGVAPTATITLLTTSPTGADAVDFQVAFDGTVASTFDSSDVSLTGTLAGSVAVVDADPTYTVTVTLTDAGADGTVGISVGTGVTDPAGNPYAGGSSDLCDIFNWNGFTQEPQAARGYNGDPHTFTVVADCGASTLSYQWKWDDGAKAIHNVGTGLATYVIPDVTGLAGDYSCEVTYDGSTYPSAAAVLEVADHVSITGQPTGGDYIKGEAHTFTVTATGGYAPFVYTWKQDGGIVGTDASLVLDTLEVSHTGEYLVEILDDNGDLATSNTAQLNVDAGVPIAGLTGMGLLAGGIALAGLLAVRRRK